MDIVTVLEPDTPTNIRLLEADFAPADPQGPVRRAHAAPAEASGVCGPLTLCGLDTGEMTLAPHRPTDPDQPWRQARWNTCYTCRTAEQNAGPAAQDRRDDGSRPAGTTAG
ncbi:hypothetical protein OG618_35595 [Kitasatospora sp. NBC_01246]|uniref:hypothetical protein n=1 Tax=Kitasatospora sp. NBC_01246 TaxID=2903570 RepID=UPI002E2F112C|nr:hypothetical protein [Kitasatospora sp. NBC_01246]